MVERIIELIKEKGMSVNAVERQLGFGNGAIKRFDTNSPSIDKIITLSNFLNTTIDYLVYGTNNNSTDNSLLADEKELLTYYKGLRDINKGRVIGTAKTLAEIEASEPESAEQETIFIEFATLKASAGTGEPLIDDPERDYIEVIKNDDTLLARFAIQIHGDSMEPEFSDGDIVLVKAQPQIELGEVGIFTINDNGYIKKRGKDRLISLNPEYDDIYFEEGQDIRCRGLVIAILDENDIISN